MVPIRPQCVVESSGASGDQLTTNRDHASRPLFMMRYKTFSIQHRMIIMDHREHQTGMDTGVKDAKGCIKILWARGESRMDGR